MNEDKFDLEKIIKVEAVTIAHMKANELRMGNWVQVEYDGILQEPEQVWKVTISSRDNYHTVNDWKIEALRPIPLTEEWLERFGFKKFKNHNDWSKRGVIIHGRKRGFVLRRSVPVIKYVHQLQNLYFALTGEELEVK